MSENDAGRHPWHDPRPTATLLLDDAGIDYRLHRHEPVMRAEDHAISGLPWELSAKTLAFRAGDDRTALVCLPAAAKLAYGALARAVGASRSQLRPASSEDLGRLAMRPGGVCPFAEPDRAQVVIDVGLLGLPVIYLGSGDPRATVEIVPEQLRRACPAARVAEIAAATG